LIADSVNRSELRLAITLSGVIALRMLGLFMILPVFMILARETPGFTPLLGGLAVGVYGLTQAIFQQPFGWLSDSWGRRRVLFLGMTLFALGGLIAALAETMTGIIVGRCLQGSGAIAGVAMAFAADQVRPEKRPVTMAVIGMGIGGAFLLSMALAVPLANWIGLMGMFWLTTLLAVLGMGLILTIPGEESRLPESANPGSSKPSVVWLLSGSVFLLHAVMTQLFVVLPGLLVDEFGFALPGHWKIYLPTMLISVLFILPLLARSGTRAAEQKLLLPAFGLLAVSLASISWSGSLSILVGLLMAYFMAFNLLEATMPALLARYVQQAGRGRRMGVYSSFQFLGAFVGGISGGWILGRWGASAALLLAAVFCALWTVVIGLLSMRVFLTGKPE
jgi:MFS family permease